LGTSTTGQGASRAADVVVEEIKYVHKWIAFGYTNR
jgi:hypothetical protein